MLFVMRPFTVITVVLGLAASGTDGAQTTPAVDNTSCATITSANTDDCVRLNQIQVLGTHNSYHIAPKPRCSTQLGSGGRDSNIHIGR